MARRRDAHHLVGVHLHPLQLVKRRLVLDEADVDFAVHDLARNLVQAAAIDADLDVGELLQVGAQRRRQQIDGRRLVRRDRQRAGLQRLELGDLAQRLVAQVDHAPRVVGQHAAGLGQRDLVHVARKERRADFFLELLDALADRRLRAAHALGGARERAFFDDGEKVFELQQIHEPSPLDDVGGYHRLVAVPTGGNRRHFLHDALFLDELLHVRELRRQEVGEVLDAGFGDDDRVLVAQVKRCCAAAAG